MVGDTQYFFTNDWSGSTCSSTISRYFRIFDNASDTDYVTNYTYPSVVNEFLPPLNYPALVRYARELCEAFRFHLKRKIPFYLFKLEPREFPKPKRPAVVERWVRVITRTSEPRWKQGRWKAKS